MKKEEREEAHASDSEPPDTFLDEESKVRIRETIRTRDNNGAEVKHKENIRLFHLPTEYPPCANAQGG